MVESTLLTLINLENNRVVYQSEPQFRSDPESLNKVLVRNNNGQMAPYFAVCNSCESFWTTSY
jgi:multidrug efflux pump subunit AcrB